MGVSVTSRINKIKQPRGGYLKVSDLNTVQLPMEESLNEIENIHPTLIGLCVDYLTRFMITNDKLQSYKISLQGAHICELMKIDNAYQIASDLLEEICGLDDESIINSCKIVSFDVWYRNPIGAMASREYSDINPDKCTIENIRIMVKRSIAFFDEYGPIIQDGFTFEPDLGYKISSRLVEENIKELGSFGGYTATVSKGDGDFLTKDTLWDFKVSKNKPKKEHTLQLLMYWIMGQHSGKSMFNEIDKIGIYNPRLNIVYSYEIRKIPPETIIEIEQEVICYE